jgi:hypothetical protein
MGRNEMGWDGMACVSENHCYWSYHRGYPTAVNTEIESNSNTVQHLLEGNSAILGCIRYCSSSKQGRIPPAVSRANRDTPSPCSKAWGLETTGGS